MAYQIALTALMGVSTASIESTTTRLGAAYKNGAADPHVYLWSSVVTILGGIFMALLFASVMTFVER
jgi:hypothetical protein